MSINDHICTMEDNMSKCCVLNFKTRKGNDYIMDGNTNNIIPVDELFLKALHLFENDDADVDSAANALISEGAGEKEARRAARVVSKYKELGYFYRDEEYEAKQRRFQKDFGTDSITALYNNGVMFQLILNLTEDCNLRCKYCYLSEVYDYTRNRTCNMMSFEVAKSAIDKFVAKIRKTMTFNPGKKAAITFYGGEPLMNYKVLKQAVEYTNAEYPDVDLLYNITTNGTLLTDEYAKFLTDNNFVISVSFDGSKKNHDRNRVFSDGKGSFDTVYGNLKRFRENYPDYAMVRLLLVQDHFTDLLDNDRFFEENSGIIPNIAMVNFVLSTNTGYFSNVTAENVQNYFTQYNQLIQKYMDRTISGEAMSSYLYMMLGMGLYVANGRPRVNNAKVPMLPFTAACVPGTKISVRTDGTYDMCERVNSTIPIGDVNNGIDKDTVRDIIIDYNDKVTKSCHECPVTSMCGACYANCNTCKTFERPDCNGNVASAALNLSILYSILEEDPELHAKFDIPDLEWILNN